MGCIEIKTREERPEFAKSLIETWDVLKYEACRKNGEMQKV